jgi:hypothetical protein
VKSCQHLPTRTRPELATAPDWWPEHHHIKLLGCCIVTVTTVILIEWECRRKDMLDLLDIKMHIPFVWSLGTFDGVLYKAIRITHVDRIQWTSCQSDAESIPLPTLSSAKKDADLLPPWAAWCACAVHTPKVLSCFFTYNPSLHHTLYRFAEPSLSLVPGF